MTPSGSAAGSSQSSRALSKQTVARLRTASLLALGYVVVIWAVFLINKYVFGMSLNYFGIRPLDTATWWHIFTAPFLHANVNHVLSNTISGAVFCFLIGLSGARVFWEVTLITMLVGGAGTWAFGGVGTSHIGASGLIYGWLSYLIVRGIFNRSGAQVVLGVTLAITYSGLIWGVFPSAPDISWQAHLFGAIGGIIAGACITSDDPPALRNKKKKKSLQK